MGTTNRRGGHCTRSNILSVDFSQNLEADFANVQGPTERNTQLQSNGIPLPNIDLEANCTVQSYQQMTCEPVGIVRNLEELFVNVHTVSDDNVHQDAVIYHDIGDPNNICQNCNAIFWFEERMNKGARYGTPKYFGCCGHGKIVLPKMMRPPKRLLDLFFTHGEKQKEFLRYIRRYNNMFAFTSLGAKVDKSINIGNGPPIFRIHGQNYHLIGGLIPQQGNRPKFAQLYIHDTDNEVDNRISSFSVGEKNTRVHL